MPTASSTFPGGRCPAVFRLLHSALPSTLTPSPWHSQKPLPLVWRQYMSLLRPPGPSGNALPPPFLPPPFRLRRFSRALTRNRFFLLGHRCNAAPELCHRDRPQNGRPRAAAFRRRPTEAFVSGWRPGHDLVRPPLSARRRPLFCIGAMASSFQGADRSLGLRQPPVP
jgi:hypothetical protein